jgi:hypothetical protein
MGLKFAYQVMPVLEIVYARYLWHLPVLNEQDKTNFFGEDSKFANVILKCVTLIAQVILVNKWTDLNERRVNCFASCASCHPAPIVTLLHYVMHIF